MQGMDALEQCPVCHTSVPTRNLTLHTAHCQTSGPSQPPPAPDPRLLADLDAIGNPITRSEPPPSYQPPPSAPPMAPPPRWHTVERRGMFALEANQCVSRVVQTSQVQQSGTLGEAVGSLSAAPQEYLQQDLAAIRSSDKWDNSTLEYGPDEKGIVWQISHHRSLNWWLQHDCQAVLSQRHVEHNMEPGDGLLAGYRLIIRHPRDPSRAIAVMEHAAASSGQVPPSSSPCVTAALVLQALQVLDRACDWTVSYTHLTLPTKRIV
eukprot:TRINITY_DN45223_c0_g1_i1.p1 TRINITY_DN45223_c0_g1~~TRINITY_DN45223_c0_g1_i1.p1  ORF type:complete len:264 (-),score=27.62 TRINITY_DN45223_c0_g1_i1:46-837(-)